MREISGDLHIVDYKTKMVIASLKPEDYIEDLRHWELKDNADILDIKLLDESPFLIYFQQKNLILKETRPGVITPYVITEIAKDSAAHTASVYASGEWIKLDKDAYISPQKITSKDAAYYMNFATARTVWEVGIIEAVGTRTMTIDTFTSPLRFIKEVATLFDNVEIQYRIVMNPTKPPTRYIDLVKKRGRETDKEIILGKDLLGIKRIENSENIITALVPFVMGRDADGNDKLITIESVNNGLQYIVDDAAYQRWNVDGKHLFGFYTPETDNEDMAPARLLTLAKTELKKRVDTIVSYEVDSVDISRVFGYEHEVVGEGDTIRIIDEGMTPTLYLEARAVAGDESRKDKRKNKYTFGNFVEIINPDEALRKLYQKMLTMIGDKVPKEWFGALETKLEETKKKADTAAEESQTAKDLANATKDYMDQNMVDVVTQPTPPTNNLKDGKTIWIDNSNPTKKVQKLWKGGQWIVISPDLAPLEKATGDLNKEVNTLKTDVDTAKKNITDMKVDIGNKVDTTFVNQKLEGKADKEGVYTKDYIDKNLVGKQIYEVDKQANIKGFQDINTKYDQTAEALKLTATKEELKQTNTNVTNVTKTVNEVKISADENSKKIEKVEGDFKNMKIGSVNLAIESEFICDVKNATVNYSSLKNLKTSTKVNYRNKKLNLSYILTGNITGKGTSLWMGAELTVRYVDGTIEYLSLRRDGHAVGTTWADTLQSAVFTIKDKDVKEIGITTGSRDVFGNINISHVQLEEGTIPTAWNPAIEESVSTGEFTKTTNEIKQTADENTAKITKVESSFTNNNYLVQSSANKEYPEFAGDVGGHQASRSTMTFENDYIKLVSTDGLDSFYQIGNYKMTDLRGFVPGKEYTFSADLVSNSGFAHLVVFQSNGTGWAESDQIAVKTGDTSFVRGALTFKVKADAKGIILRIRFPMSANSTGKYICFKNVKLEDGVIPTRWTPAGIDEKTFVKTTNEIKQGVEENSQTITKVEKKVIDQDASIADVNKTTNEIKQTVDTNSQTISKVQQDQGTMQTNLNRVEQTTNSNSQTIATLTQTQGQQGAIIQQNTSDITQLNNQIKSKVSDTQMQEYVGGLGSANVLFNAAFENRVINATTGIVTSRTPSTTKWSVVGVGSGITIVSESARHHDGYNSVKITATGQTTAKWAGVMQRVSAVQNGGDYVFSAWIYVQDKNTLDGGGAIKLQFFNGSNAVSTFAQTEIKDLLANNAWTLVSVKITSPNVAITHLQGDIWVRQNGTMWVSQPQLQQGSTPSTFMENPKDYANYDQLVGEVAKKVATTEFNSKVSTLETSINQQSNRIDLKAEKNDVYNKVDSDGRYGSKAIVESHTSTLSVMSNEIDLRVKSGDIASTINQTAQSVLIQAGKIYLDGYIEAKHLKAQTLQGVTIQTAPAGSGANQIRLNAQNLTVYGGGRSRGYLGFIERTDGNVQSALILGNDYETTGTLNGSLVIDQTTINSNVFTNSMASIGIATGRNGNDVTKSSYINFYRYDGAMQINSVGDMSLTNTNGNINLTASSTSGITGFITMSASKDIYFTAKRGYFNFYTSDNKSFPALIIKDLAPTTQGDVDFTFANQIMFRVARHPDYVGDGLQIKNATGDAFRDIKLRTLRAEENISAVGQMWAKAFNPTSARNMKENIKDIPFSALEKIMDIAIKQYNFKDDMYDLYQMRVNKSEERTEPYTTKEIETYFGMIADYTDDIFTDKEKRAINLYNTVSILIAAFQQFYQEFKGMREENKQLKERVGTLENEVSVLKELFQKLINEKPEQP